MAKKGTFPANAMRRGEIYWVDIPNAIGHELMKDRPAIIVSCDTLNDNSPVVQVVYCSASSPAWGWPSTALQAPRRTRRSRSRYAGTPRTARPPWPW